MPSRKCSCVSPGFASSSLISRNMPHKSPAQEMGNAAFAVRSPPSAAKTVSSPEETNAFLRRISSSNCLETGLSSRSFFGIPAVAMMRSRSHTAVPMPLAAEMHSAMFLALSFSSPTGEYLRKMMLPSLSMKISSGVPSLIFMVRRSSFGTTTRPRSSARVKYSQKYFFECEKALILLDFLALGVFSVKNKSPHPMCYFRTNSLYSRLFSFQRRSWATACVSFPAPSTYYLSCVFGFFKTSLSTWLEVATLMHIAIFHCTGSFSKVPAKMFPIFQVMSSSLEQ